MPHLLTAESLRLALLFAHLICCAFAISYVLRADMAIARASFTRGWLSRMATTISRLLIALWLTGLAIIWIDTGFEWAALTDKPKLVLKLLCVCVLTVNGLFLHYLSFPVLTQNGPLSVANSMLLSVTGALSTCHWMAAAFVGIAKPLGQVPLEVLAKAYAVCFGVMVFSALLLTPVIRHQMLSWRLNNPQPQLRLSFL